MKFGDDFNPAQPTDGEFVRSPDKDQFATEVRDLKFRIKDFFCHSAQSTGTLSFNTTGETGNLIHIM